MKKVHTLKILKKYADEVYKGTKTFEVRKNDRNFKSGDFIRFTVLTNDGARAMMHPLSEIKFGIMYVLDGFEGLAPGYVAFSIYPMVELNRGAGDE